VSADEQAWARYLAWNDALADQWFSEEQADAPVYLDVEPEVLQAAATKLGAEGDPAASLAKAVSATVWLGQGQRSAATIKNCKNGAADVARLPKESG